MRDIFIEDFYAPADGDDWLPAFDRAQAQLGTFGPSTGRSAEPPFYHFRGFTLRFQARSYYFSGTLHLKCPMALLGSGAHGDYPGTVLMFPKGTKGIVVHTTDTMTQVKFAGLEVKHSLSYAGGSSIEKLTLLAVDPERHGEADVHLLMDQRESSYLPSQGAHGITAFSRMTVRDVTVAKFDGHGIYIYGNGGGADRTALGVQALAALTRLDMVFVTGNGGDGLHIFGGDANVCTVIGSQFVHNCAWGVRDLSRLGQNSFIGCQMAYNRLGGVCRPGAVLNRDHAALIEILPLEIAALKAIMLDLEQEQQALEAELAAGVSRERDAKIAARLAAIKVSMTSTDTLITGYDGIVRHMPTSIAKARSDMFDDFAADPAMPKTHPMVPDPANYPLLLETVTAATPTIPAAMIYNTTIREYFDALDDLARRIGDWLVRLLKDEGLVMGPDVTHYAWQNPFAAGGDVFINIYAEDNGIGAGIHNVLGAPNLCIGSEFISNMTDTRSLSGNGYKIFLGSADGSDVVARQRLVTGLGVETPRLRLGTTLDPDSLASKAGCDIAIGDALPAGGQIGDIVFNSAPQPGGNAGWINTAAGWKEFGAIAV